MADKKIVVHLGADDSEDAAWAYCAVILEWGDGPTWYYNEATGKQEILPGTENGGWHNTGVVCRGPSYEDVFAQALKTAKDRWPGEV